VKEKQTKKNRIIGEPSSQELEQHLIVEFLAKHKLTLADLKTLPEDEARKLRIEALQYATARLAELEARSGFIHKIHDATRKVTS
jgi:hypothetical protein